MPENKVKKDIPKKDAKKKDKKKAVKPLKGGKMSSAGKQSRSFIGPAS